MDRMTDIGPIMTMKQLDATILGEFGLSGFRSCWNMGKISGSAVLLMPLHKAGFRPAWLVHHRAICRPACKAGANEMRVDSEL